MKISTHTICRAGLIASALFGSQVAMSSLPNIEVVSAIIIAGTIAFGWEMMLPVSIFSILEILFWGMGPWNIMYLYVWHLLVAITMLLRNILKKHWWLSVVLATAYGLAFGTLCSVPYFVLDKYYAITWIVKGIPFDVLHACGNCMTMVALYYPLTKVFTLSRRMENGSCRIKT